MGKIIEAQNLPEGTKVYLKKDFGGYRVVHPIMDPETGKLNWFNLITGGWRNIITVIVLVAMLLWVQYDTNNQIAEYKAYCEPVSKDPVKFCDNLGYYDALEQKNKQRIGEFDWGELETPNLTIKGVGDEAE